MNSRVNVSKLFIAAAIIFVVKTLLDYLFNRFVEASWIPEMFPAPKPEDVMMSRVWVYLSRVVFAIMFTFVYTKGYEGKAGLGEGLRYGFYIGLMLYLPTMFANLVVTTAPASFVVTHNLVSLVEAIICGLVVGMTYKSAKPAAA